MELSTHDTALSNQSRSSRTLFLEETMSPLTAEQLEHAKILARLSVIKQRRSMKMKVTVDTPMQKLASLKIWVAVWGGGVLVLYFWLFNG
jgi:hypothetical protein